MESSWITTAQLAQLWGKTPKAIRCLKAQGKLPYRKFNGTLFFNLREIEALIETSDGLRVEAIKKG